MKYSKLVTIFLFLLIGSFCIGAANASTLTVDFSNGLFCYHSGFYGFMNNGNPDTKYFVDEETFCACGHARTKTYNLDDAYKGSDIHFNMEYSGQPQDVCFILYNWQGGDVRMKARYNSIFYSMQELWMSYDAPWNKTYNWYTKGDKGVVTLQGAMND
ncbi:MAG: hypothetical protein LBR15_06110 [Methanobrevibacter sp.]|jgi:hypothetical protein|nr:hypothetical protein [Candidatus Methanovirga australis]